MATYKDLQNRIALDYLNRYDLIPEVKRAIQNSIRCYEGTRFWFNETATSTTTTANSASLGLPADFLILDRLELTYGGARYTLHEESYDTIREMNAVSVTGVPSHFAQRGDQFELALIPDSAYAVNTIYVHTLATLSADTDTNAWTNEAQNLIVHAAMVELLCSTLASTNDRHIEQHERMRQRALIELQTKNTQRLIGRIRATQF